MSKENEYNLGGSGRVKAAGVSVDLLFDAAQDFRKNGSVSGAKHAVENFNTLRVSPPEEVRDRFFPRDRGNKAKFRSGSLLLRPIIKTDQGAGQFLPFDFDLADGEHIDYHIDSEEGFCIEEGFFESQLRQRSFPKKVMEEIADLKSSFRNLNIPEAQLAYERMQIACEEEGIQTQREVGVGRDAMFFIRPSQAREAISLSKKVKLNIEKAISTHAERFTSLATEERAKFAKLHALNVKTENGNLNEPLYFQADMQVLPNGDVLVDQLQLPDVGLFLLDLDTQSSNTLSQVQKRVAQLTPGIIEDISRKAESLGTKYVNLVTRDEVLKKDEDLLEQKEIKVITDNLRDRGITAKAISLREIVNIPQENMNLLLNVDTNSTDFENLLACHVEGRVKNIYPDPFLLKAKDRMTDYSSVRLTQGNVEQLRAITKEVDVSGNAERSFVQLMALDNFFRKLGLEDDVFHIYTSSQHTPVPCFRFDAKGFQIAANYIKDGDSVSIRSVPITPEKAILFDQKRKPLYSVFRTMVYQK